MRYAFTHFVFPIVLGLIAGLAVKSASELMIKPRLQPAMPFVQSADMPPELRRLYAAVFQETVMEILAARLPKPVPPEIGSEPPSKKMTDIEILENAPRPPRGLVAIHLRETLLPLVRHCKDGKPIGEFIPKLQYYNRRCVNEALDPLRRSGISVTDWYKLSSQQLLTPSG